MVCGGLCRRPPHPRGSVPDRRGIDNGWNVVPRGGAGRWAVGGAGKEPSRRKPERWATAPLSNPRQGRHWRAGHERLLGRWSPPISPSPSGGCQRQWQSSCQRLVGVAAWREGGCGRWVAAGTFVPAGSRKGELPPPFRTLGKAGTGVPGTRGCWGDGIRPSPQAPLAAASGSGSRLVRGW